MATISQSVEAFKEMKASGIEPTAENIKAVLAIQASMKGQRASSGVKKGGSLDKERNADIVANGQLVIEPYTRKTDGKIVEKNFYLHNGKKYMDAWGNGKCLTLVKEE